MKIACPLILLFLLPYSIFAQEIAEIEFGKKIKSSMDPVYVNGQFYFISGKGNRVSQRSFETSSFDWSEKYYFDFTIEGLEVWWYKNVSSNEKQMHVVYTYEEESRTLKYYLVELVNEELSNFYLIVERTNASQPTPNDSQLVNLPISLTDDFFLISSPNGKFFAVRFSLGGGFRREYHYVLLNKDLEFVSDFKPDTNTIVPGAILLDEKGAYHYINRDKDSVQLLRHIQFNPASGEQKTTIIDVGELFLSYDMRFTQNGDVVVFGALGASVKKNPTGSFIVVIQDNIGYQGVIRSKIDGIGEEIETGNSDFMDGKFRFFLSGLLELGQGEYVVSYSQMTFYSKVERGTCVYYKPPPNNFYSTMETVSVDQGFIFGDILLDRISMTGESSANIVIPRYCDIKQMKWGVGIPFMWLNGDDIHMIYNDQEITNDRDDERDLEILHIKLANGNIEKNKIIGYSGDVNVINGRNCAILGEGKVAVLISSLNNFYQVGVYPND